MSIIFYMISLRIIGINGTTTSISIPAESLFKALKDLIVDSFQISATQRNDIEILYGFPPQACKLLEDEPISPSIQSGQTLRIILSKKVDGEGFTTLIPSINSSTVSTAKSKKLPPKKSSPSPQTGKSSNIVTLKGTDVSSRSFKVQNSQDKPTPKRVKRIRTSGQGTSENDIAEHLIEALSGGKGTRNKILRKVFRNAVSLQYKSSQAVARLGAVYAGKYSIVERSSARILGTGNATQIEVTFSKGAGSKGTNFVDIVDLLSAELLREVVRFALVSPEQQAARAVADSESFQGREVLKPTNLSKCSPRIFWSLVHHHGPNIHQSIRNLLRGLDDNCDWLDERKRELSEKAKRNLEQQQEKVAAAAARRRKRQKVQLEIQNENQQILTETTPQSAQEGEVKVDSPVESERVKAAAAFVRSLSDAIKVDEDLVPAEWIPAVAAALGGSRRAAALAAMDSSAKNRNRIVELKLSSSSSSSSSGNGDAVVGGDLKPSRYLSIDQLESWVESARVRLVSAFWRAICGGGGRKVFAALKKVG